MASWTDGPEYAPVERPDVFVAPDAAPLAGADTPDAVPPAEHGPAPRSEPPAFEPAEGAPPLADLVLPVVSSRDPHEAFDVVTTPLTTWQAPAAPASAPAPAPPSAPTVPPELHPTSAWGSVHAPTHAAPQPGPGWAPDQPFPTAAPPPPTHYPAPARDWPPPQVNPADFPPPEASPWQPAVPPTPPPGPQPVTFDRVLAGVTPGVLIALGIGILIGPLSGVMYFLAWVLASRIRYRRARIARMFSIGAFAMLGLGFGLMLLEYGTFDIVAWYESSVMWAQLANLVVGVSTILAVRNAIARGDPPEPTAGY